MDNTGYKRQKRRQTNKWTL